MRTPDLDVPTKFGDSASLVLDIKLPWSEARASDDREQVLQPQVVQLAGANEAFRATEALRTSSDRLETGSLEQFLESTVRHAIEICGASAGAVNLPTEDQCHLEIVASLQRETTGGALVPIESINPVIPLKGFVREVWEEIKSTTEYCWRSLDDPRIPEDFRRLDRNRGYTDVVLVPIRLGGTTLGHLALSFGTQPRPSEAQLQVARVLAQQSALAIQMMRLGESARQAAVAREREQAMAERVAELARANQAMLASSGRLVDVERLDDFLEVVLRAAITSCGAAAGRVVLQSEDVEFLQVILKVDDSGLGGALVRLRLLDEFIRVTPEVREIWNDVTSADYWWGIPDAICSTRVLLDYQVNRGPRQIARIPIRLRGEMLGYLGLAFRSEDKPSEGRLELTRVFAQQAALAIAMTRMAGESRQAAVTRERELAAQERVSDLVRANEAMRRSSEQLVAIDDQQNFLDAVVRTCVEVCGSAAGTVGIMDSDGRHLRIVSMIEECAGENVLVVPSGVDASVPMTADATRAWLQIATAEGCWWTTPDNPSYPESFRAWHQRRGHREVAHFPIRLHGTTLGFLALSYRDGKRPSDVHVAICGVLSQQAALAIGVTRLAKVAQAVALAQDRAERLDAANEALRRSIERTASEEGASGVLYSVLEESIRLIGAVGGLVSAVDLDNGNRFEPMAIALHGKPLPLDEWMKVSGIESLAELSVEDPSGLLARVRTGEEVVSSLDEEGQIWEPEARAFMLRVGARQCATLPMRSRGAVVGLLALWLPHAEPPTSEQLNQLRAFAIQAALSLELIRFRELTSKAATEAERARIAGEIHDGLAQAFLAVMMQARAARIAGSLHKRDVSQFLERIESLAAEGLEEARRSLFALRSISVESDGLIAALQRLLSNLSVEGRTQCVLVNGVAKLEATPPVEDVMYRIVQEATQNALKHADAQEVTVKLDLAEGGLRIVVEDDGAGMPSNVVQQARERGGLRAMRDRAERCGGRLIVESRAPRGTRVTAVFPAPQPGVGDDH